MIKRFVLVVLGCLTALLISSCSDGGTKSGVLEQALLTSTECIGEDRGPCDSASSTSSNTSTSSSTNSDTTTTTVDTTGGGCYGDYVRNSPDLLAAYNASGGGQTIEAWGKSHYDAYGKAEGRTLPANCTSSDTTTTADSTTTSTSTDGLPVGDYQYLCKHNECSKHSNRTMRWSSKTINVYTPYPSLYRGIQGSWPVTFNLGAGGGITLEAGFGNWCGAAVPEMYTDGTIRGCRVRINFLHRELSCGSLKATVIHEIGHCIGFFEHTADGGLMDATANNATGTNSTIRNMISLLYSLPPGTDVSSRLRSYSRNGGYKYSRDNPQKLPPKVYYKHMRD